MSRASVKASFSRRKIAAPAVVRSARTPNRSSVGPSASAAPSITATMTVRLTWRWSTGSTFVASRAIKSSVFIFLLPRDRRSQSPQPSMHVDFHGRYRHAALHRGLAYAQAIELHTLDRLSHLPRQAAQKPMKVICAFRPGMIVLRHDFSRGFDRQIGER